MRIYMCTDVYICIHTYDIYIHMHIHTYVRCLYIHAYTYIYIYTHIYIYVCTYIYICISIYVGHFASINLSSLKTLETNYIGQTSHDVEPRIIYRSLFPKMYIKQKFSCKRDQQELDYFKGIVEQTSWTCNPKRLLELFCKKNLPNKVSFEKEPNKTWAP